MRFLLGLYCGGFHPCSEDHFRHNYYDRSATEAKNSKGIHVTHHTQGGQVISQTDFSNSVVVSLKNR